RWASDFDNWAICDTACFHLFDRTMHAFNRIEAWADKEALFIKRAAFALIASVALHDKDAEDALFLEVLPLIEAAANDERNFVKKAVSWALRGIGKRNPTLCTAATELSTRLSTSDDRTRRWIGKDALRDLNKKPGTKAKPAPKPASVPATKSRAKLRK
ncbi:MAG: DNA alkylation repair protein, partial [Planctomycetota bacterium]|nr:DNA alkylation repair protein [Planctomycetota bacterium]